MTVAVWLTIIVALPSFSYSPETRLIYMKCIKRANFMRGGVSKMHDTLVANCQTERDSELPTSEFKLAF